jgi:transcriptional regulator with XRE-family HTH domain
MLKMTELREARGWSRAELGRRARIHPVRIGMIENLRVRPYWCECERIAAALEVPPSELFDSEGWPLGGEAVRIREINPVEKAEEGKSRQEG